MAIKWITEADTGELIPIEDDFDCEVPAHLTVGEPIKVDYDKTLQFTIEQLENQLADLKNQAETTENEKTSDNNSAVTVNDVSPEIVSRPEKSSRHNISTIIALFIILVPAIFVFAFGLKVFIAENDIEISIPKASEQQTVDYEIIQIPENVIISNSEQLEPQERQGTEQEQSDKEILHNCIDYLISRLLSMIAPLLTVLVSLFAVRFAISILRNSM